MKTTFLERAQDEHSPWLTGNFYPIIHGTGIQGGWFVIYHTNKLTNEIVQQVMDKIGDDLPIKWEECEPATLQQQAVDELRSQLEGK